MAPLRESVSVLPRHPAMAYLFLVRSMKRAYERFLGARVLATFAAAVLTQAALLLLVVRLGLWGFLLGPIFLLTYIAVFGRAFLLALRRLQILRSTTLRFATPIVCTIVLLFCSFAVAGYIGDRLNSTVFHMPVQDFDK